MIRLRQIKKSIQTATVYKFHFNKYNPLQQSSKLYPDILYIQNFFNQQEARNYFKILKSEIKWNQGFVTLFSKQIKEPRMSAWYGDKNYVYSGKQNKPQNWTPVLLDIKQKIIDLFDQQLSFNSVLLNYYQDGQEYMGWHSDNETKFLGSQPIIASISIGSERNFQFREIQNKQNKSSLILQNGSLLIMKGLTQEKFQHQLPKTQKFCNPRINLTFRYII